MQGKDQLQRMSFLVQSFVPRTSSSKSHAVPFIYFSAVEPNGGGKFFDQEYLIESPRSRSLKQRFHACYFPRDAPEKEYTIYSNLSFKFGFNIGVSVLQKPIFKEK